MIQFLKTLPDNYTGSIAFINKDKPAAYSSKQYISLQQGEAEERIFEIGYDYHCSPFSDAAILNNVAAIGYEHIFCLFDYVKNINLIELQMDGYFGHLYIHKSHFYITDASGIYCIAENGDIKWKNQNLAVDGVIINEFLHDSILISGEWDPPGGWIDGIISIATGQPV